MSLKNEKKYRCLERQMSIKEFYPRMPHSGMRKKIKLSVFCATVICTLYLIACNIESVSVHFTEYSGFSESFQFRTHVLYTSGCKVPDFDPFDPSVSMYYQNVSGDIHCKGKKYISLQNSLVTLDSDQVLEDFNGTLFNCSYKPIFRNPNNEVKGADRKFGYGEENMLEFDVPLPEEFVKISCRVGNETKYEDFLASTPLKPAVEERCDKNSAKIEAQNPLNIIVVGIDSVSKLNFRRHFRLTADYLRRNLSAFEFHGYMKVADNTFPNLTPVLTGHFIDHYFNKSTRGMYFDGLDFIWKNFSSIGYRTLFAEDAPDMGTFNYVKNGFQYPPADYFFRPFTLAIEDTPWQKASKVDCFQANPEIVVLFNYLRSFLKAMEERPYFAFTWAARLTHNKLNKAGYADKPTYELLKDIHDAGLLNRSVLVFMSDHGIRFGGIRRTFIGKIEERMPFLFMSFPEWFLETHPEIKANLKSNQRKLTTPFDLHETLVDLYQMISGDSSYVRTPYGISLFHEISSERNCQSAFILPHWCVCHEYRKVSFRNEMVLEAKEVFVEEINNLTKPYRDVCEEVEIDKILDARVSKPEGDLLRYKELTSGDFEDSITYGNNTDSFEKLMITMKTKPGGAIFETTLRKIKDFYKTYDISRINMYGNQSDCVKDFDLRKFCYCKQQKNIS